MDSKNLLRLAGDTSADGRYKLANAVSELFEHEKLNDMEHRLVVEIMMSLINRAELDLREALAERLAVLSNVPAEVVIFLANDEISVARPVLEKSPVLNDVDLVYIISSKTEEYWQSIAQREKLSNTVVGRLVDTGDIGTAVRLSDNPRISLPKNTLKRLIKMSLNGEALQESLARRPEIDSELAVELYSCVSHILRREINRRFNLPAQVIETSLDNLVEELTLETRGQHVVTAEMMSLARRFKERAEISPATMLKVLRRGQVAFFVALFSVQIGLPTTAVFALLRKDGGKPFAAACRAVGMMKTEFASIYLLSRGARTEDRIVDQRELADVLKYFDTVRDTEVHRLCREWAENPATI